ncbi:MAG: hypothetical protein PUH25_03095 [Spirochaetales bacterium]|nr:hypothetical protein [Spirochaetales bacterium]
MMRAISLVIALLMIFSSCTSTSNTYSKSEYLTGKGYGMTAEDAQLNAKVELASLFGTNVKSVTARTITENKDGYDESFIKASEIVIDVEDLYGLEIAETKREKDGRYTSVAIINKEVASSRYKAEIENLLNSLIKIEKLPIEANGSFESLEKAVSYYSLVEKYNMYVSIINYLDNDNISYYDIRKAENVYKEVSNSICLEIVLSGDENGKIEAELARILTDMGIKISGGSEMPTVIAEGQINFRKIQGTGIASDFVFAEYDIEIRLRDLLNDRALFVYTSHGREGHQDYGSAKSRAIAVIIEELESSFREQFEDKYSL